MVAGGGVIRSRSVAVLVALAIAAGARPARADDDDLALGVVDARRRIALAEDLHHREMLYREIGVLEELRLFAPTPALSVWARLRIAIAYQQASQYGEAIAEYDALFVERALPAELEGLAHVQRALAMATPIVHEPGHPGADAILGELAPLMAVPGEVGTLASYHRARLAAVMGDHGVAIDSLAHARTSCGEGLAPCAAVEALAARIDGPGPARRSPALAIVLSVIVPGAGSMYARHWVDGFYYLGLTGLSALGALDIYDPDRGAGDQQASFYGLAALATTFYLSNLVNAYGSAKRFNRVEAHRWRERLWVASDLPLPLADVPAPAFDPATSPTR
jgi:hypothetical protein